MRGRFVKLSPEVRFDVMLAYFLGKNILHLTLEEYNNLPLKTASRVYTMLTEADQIAKEEAEKKR